MRDEATLAAQYAADLDAAAERAEGEVAAQLEPDAHAEHDDAMAVLAARRAASAAAARSVDEAARAHVAASAVANAAANAVSVASRATKAAGERPLFFFPSGHPHLATAHAMSLIATAAAAPGRV